MFSGGNSFTYLSTEGTLITRLTKEKVAEFVYGVNYCICDSYQICCFFLINYCFYNMLHLLDELNSFYKKVIDIMLANSVFGCFRYTANNNVAVATLENSFQ